MSLPPDQWGTIECPGPTKEQKVAAAERRRMEEDKDNGISCQHCLKFFDETSSFLRHIGHHKTCKLSYDDEWIARLRRKNRLRSRRNSYHWMKKNNPGMYKKMREESKAKNPNNQKKYYVPDSVKQTHNGRLFEKVFKVVFDKCIADSRGKLQEMAKRKNFLHDYAVDIALDDVFEHSIGDAFQFDENASEKEQWTRGFENLEEIFNQKLTEIHLRNIGIYISDRLTDLKNYRGGLYFKALNKAFREIYNAIDFKILLEGLEDVALDVVFDSMVMDFEDNEDLEAYLEKSYSRVFLDELLRKDTGDETTLEVSLELLICGYIEKILEKIDHLDDD